MPFKVPKSTLVPPADVTHPPSCVRTSLRAGVDGATVPTSTRQTAPAASAARGDRGYRPHRRGHAGGVAGATIPQEEPSMRTVMPVFPGPIRQNAYVVPDLHAEMERWLRLGVGPWIVLPSFVQADSEYRGRATAPVVSIGFANSGELQIELIQQEDDAPSIYKEFTDGGRSGFHHVAFWSEDFDATMAATRDAGWPVVHHGTGGGLARFAYVDAGGFTSTVVEVMELNDVTRAMTASVREAAVAWDGSDPVRLLG